MSIITAIENEKTARAIIETGHELAIGLGETQVVVHVVPSATDGRRRRNDIEELVRDALEDEGPEIELLEERSVWERDGPADRISQRIIDRAGAGRTEYIVVGSRKRSPSGKAILGSVAQLVLLDSSIPVVVVEQNG